MIRGEKIKGDDMNVIEFLQLTREMKGPNWEKRLIRILRAIHTLYKGKEEVGLNSLKEEVQRTWEKLLNKESLEVRKIFQRKNFGTRINSRVFLDDTKLVEAKKSRYLDEDTGVWLERWVAVLTEHGKQSIQFLSNEDLQKTTGIGDKSSLVGSSKLTREQAEEANTLRMSAQEHYENTNFEASRLPEDPDEVKFDLTTIELSQGSEMIELDVAMLEDSSYMNLVKQDVLNSKSLHVDASNHIEMSVGRDNLPEYVVRENQELLFKKYEDNLKTIVAVYSL